MRICVIGGTGNISRAVVRAGVAAGHEMTVINRGTRKVDFGGPVTEIIADRKDAAAFAAAVKDVQADAVIDMIAYDAADAAFTLKTFAGKTGQFLFTSSSAAYDRPYRAYPITEANAPLMTENVFPYGFNKAEMERYLCAQMDAIPEKITIIRPSLTFGEGGFNVGVMRQNAGILRRMQLGKPLLMCGDGSGLITLTFTPDIARAYIGLCGNPAAYGEAFHITSDTCVGYEQIYEAVGRARGLTPHFVYAPTKKLYDIDPALFGHLWIEKRWGHVFSNEKIKADVPGWEAVIGLDEGMKRQVEFWESIGMPVDPERDAYEDELCARFA